MSGNETPQPTDNLGELISRAVAARLTPDYVEKAVAKRLDDLVERAVEDALGSYSDSGKTIKAAVIRALEVRDLDLPSYGETVTKMLCAQIEARVNPLVNGKLAEDMAELLKLSPAEVKLSEIADHMRQAGGHDEYYEQRITVIVERSDYGFVHLYLDEEQVHSERDKYSCRHQVHLDKEGKIYAATLDGRYGREIGAGKNIVGRYGIAQLIRSYYACGTKIILDEDAVDTGENY